MEQRYLEDVIQFSLGKNPSRVDENEELYSTEDFDTDLLDNMDNLSIILINLIKSKAAPLSNRNSKKCITSNYLRCELDESKIDPWYFCYQFNEGKSIQQQIGMYHQGNTLSVKKLNIALISQLLIPLPTIEKQKSIGELYRLYIKRQELLRRQYENYNTLNKEIIRLIEEDFTNER